MTDLNINDITTNLNFTIWQKIFRTPDWKLRQN